MTDKELLELAAKAAGYIVKDAGWTDEFLCLMVDAYTDEGEQCHQRWNPLTDDGDALLLAVKLSQMEGGLALCLNSRLNSYGFAQCYTNENTVSPTEDMSHDPYAATRRAIVRAAAEIGKNT